MSPLGLVEIAGEAAAEGARVITEAWPETMATEFKGVGDPVTAVDRAAERAIVGVLDHHAPADGILAEEGSDRSSSTGRTWVVDPLDGTVNFVHRLPHVGVSVAVWQGATPLAGAIVDVRPDELYAAAADSGATRDLRPISVSSVASLDEALVVTGFPYDRDRHGREYAATLGEVLVRVQGVRRFGAATLDFAAVASGAVDAYYEFGLSPWDAAAGTLLVREAGGVVTDHRGEPYHLDSSSVVATNGRIHQQLLDVLARFLPAHIADA